VTDGTSNQGVSDATVTADCPHGGTTTTNADGDYAFGLSRGDCAISVQTSPGALATPEQRIVHVTHDISNVDFRAEELTCSMSALNSEFSGTVPLVSLEFGGLQTLASGHMASNISSLVFFSDDPTLEGKLAALNAQGTPISVQVSCVRGGHVVMSWTISHGVISSLQSSSTGYSATIEFQPHDLSDGTKAAPTSVAGLHASRSGVTADVSCAAAEGTCQGSLTLEQGSGDAHARMAAAGHPPVLGRARFAIRGGRTTKVAVRLTRLGRAALRAHRRLTVATVLSIRSFGVQRLDVTRTVTLVR
jgi:hypothetical protein